MGDEFKLAQYYLKQPSDAALVMKTPRAAAQPDRERYPSPVAGPAPPGYPLDAPLPVGLNR
jgi:hypothetical protein